MKMMRFVSAAVLALCCFATSVTAQIQQAFNYQAVVRDAQGNPSVNTAMNFDISLVQNNAVVYAETQAKTTNAFGLVDLNVGQGTVSQGNFTAVNWGAATTNIRVKVNGVVLPEKPILAVPFALYALKSGGSAADSWTSSGNNIFRASGNVGIGIQNPIAKLDVDGTIRGKGMHNQGSDFNLGTNDGRSVGNIPHQRALVHDNNDILKINYAGDFEGGTIIEGSKLTTPNLDVNGDLVVRGYIFEHRGGDIKLGTNDGRSVGNKPHQRALVHDHNDVLKINYVGDFEGGVRVEGPSLSCNVLEVTGADIVEKFKSKETIEAGTLVTIDPQDINNYKTTDKAYQKGIVGIVSGANGVKHGMLLQQDDVLAGNTKVAIAGRVYVKATAQNGAIKAGDFLTSSNTTGYAMKSTNRKKAYGAVIGKALTSLESGEGYVLVLVGLQ